MLIHRMNKELSPVGEYISRVLETKRDDEGRPWSQNKLARLAGLSSGGLSMIMRGVSAPEGSTLKQIADALEIDVRPLLEIAEILEPDQQAIDPEAAYIAQKLSKLPAHLRVQAIDAVGGVVDSFTKVAEQQEATGQTSGQPQPLMTSEGVKEARRSTDGFAEEQGLDNQSQEQDNFR